MAWSRGEQSGQGDFVTMTRLNFRRVGELTVPGDTSSSSALIDTGDCSDPGLPLVPFPELAQAV